MPQPLPADVTYETFEDIPEIHRPVRDLYDKDLPGADVLARTTEYRGSRTRWCATCHRTLDAGGKQKFCKPCATERNKVRRANQFPTKFTIDAVPLARLHSEAQILQQRTQQYLNVRTSDDLETTFRVFGRITEAGKHLLSTIESLPKPRDQREPM